jgi:hypothetical protein
MNQNIKKINDGKILSSNINAWVTGNIWVLQEQNIVSKYSNIIHQTENVQLLYRPVKLKSAIELQIKLSWR